MPVTETNVFGEIVTADAVERAALTTLRTWMATYIAELERQTSRPAGSVPAIRSWTTVNEFEQTQGDQLPAAIVISPGLLDGPEKRGGGRYAAWWTVGVGVIVSARDRASSNDLAKLYAAAVRGIFVQKSSLGGLADGVQLLDEAYDDAPANYLPVGAVARVMAAFLVEAIVLAGRGPAAPITTPADWGRIQTVDIDTELRSLA